MATYKQGCSKVGGFSYASNFTLYVILTDRDGNSSTNKSFVDYNVYCQSNGSGSINAKHRRFFSINNSTKIDTTGTINASSPNAYISIASGTIEVQHNNDGTKTIPFSAQIQASSYGVSATINGNFELNKIPRYANLTSLSIKSRTINSITIQFSTDKRANIYCNVNGSSWLNSGNPFISNTTSGQFTVKFKNAESTQRLDPNSNYNFNVLARAVDSGLDTVKAISSTTMDIAKIISAPNVNIGSSHTIQWSNPSGASTSLKLCKTDNSTIINYGTVTGNSKSVTPTASTIYALTPNSNSITLRYIITTTYDGKSYTNYKNCVFFVTNSNPTFSNFDYKDVNSTTTNLTGNSKTIVKGYSTVRATISTANKAIAKNSATMKKYRLSIGSKTTEKSYSSTANVTLDISNVTSNTFVVYAIDSRENSTSKQIVANTYLSYESIKINSITVNRANNVGTEATLTFSGYIWNNNFGKVANDIVSCTYRYKKTTSSTWTNGTTTLTPTKNGNSFSYSGKIIGDLGAEGFDVDDSYNVQVLVSDKLTNNNSNPASFILGPGSPAMAIYKNNVAVGQKYDISEGSKLQVNGTVKANSFKGNATSATNLNGGVFRSSRSFLFTLSARGAEQGRFYKLARIPKSDDGNAIQLNIRGLLGNWTTSKATINLQISNREELKVYGNYYGRADALSYQRIVIYKETDGAHTVYLYNANNFTGGNTLEITWNGINTFPTIYTDYSYTTTPTGTHVYSSTTWNMGDVNGFEVLYVNTSGSQGTITLNETSANFNYLEFFYGDGTNFMSQKLQYPNGKTVHCPFPNFINNTVNLLYLPLKISGTSVTRGQGYAFNYNGQSANNDLKVFKIIGYR